MPTYNQHATTISRYSIYYERLTEGFSGTGSELDSLFCIVGSVTPIGLPLSSSNIFTGDLTLNSGSICDAVAFDVLSSGLDGLPSSGAGWTRFLPLSLAGFITGANGGSRTD